MLDDTCLECASSKILQNFTVRPRRLRVDFPLPCSKGLLWGMLPWSSRLYGRNHLVGSRQIKQLTNVNWWTAVRLMVVKVQNPIVGSLRTFFNLRHSIFQWYRHLPSFITTSYLLHWNQEFYIIYYTRYTDPPSHSKSSGAPPCDALGQDLCSYHRYPDVSIVSTWLEFQI